LFAEFFVLGLNFLSFVFLFQSLSCGNDSHVESFPQIFSSAR
jgi:hypothetical protein